MRLSRDEMNNLHFFCSLIELIARRTNNHRADIMAHFTLEDIEEELDLAEVNHCLPIGKVFEEYIENYGITKGIYHHDPEICKAFKYNQIGSFLMTYIVAEVENEGFDLAETTKDVLSSRLEELFVGID